VKVLEVVHSEGALAEAQNFASQIWEDINPIQRPGSPDEVQEDLDAIFDAARGQGEGVPVDGTEGVEDRAADENDVGENDARSDENAGEEEEGGGEGDIDVDPQSDIRSVNHTKVSVHSLLGDREICGRFGAVQRIGLGYRIDKLYYRKLRFLVHRSTGLRQLSVQRR
jgi:hypothetical protein